MRLMLYSKISYKAMWAMHMNNRWSISDVDDVIRKFAEAQTGCPVAFTYKFEEIDKLLHPYYKAFSIWKDHIFRWDIEHYIKHEYVVDSTWQGVPDEVVKAWEREVIFLSSCFYVVWY